MQPTHQEWEDLLTILLRVRQTVKWSLCGANKGYTFAFSSKRVI